MFVLRRVAGDSMQPALRAGQVVLAVRWLRPRVGDVVVLRHDGLEKIKRVAESDGTRLFVLGDNPARSTDSRTFGWLTRREHYLAKVVWPKTTPATYTKRS